MEDGIGEADPEEDNRSRDFAKLPNGFDPARVLLLFHAGCAKRGSIQSLIILQSPGMHHLNLVDFFLHFSIHLWEAECISNPLRLLQNYLKSFVIAPGIYANDNVIVSAF